jgi:hypothetical protein
MRLFPNIPPETQTSLIFRLQDQSILLKPVNDSIGQLYINGDYVGKCKIKDTVEHIKLVIEKGKLLEIYKKKPSIRDNVVNFLL